MKNIHKWFGKEKRLGFKFGLLSLFFLCLVGQSQGQGTCTILPADAIACYGSNTFNLSYSLTGNPVQYTLTTGDRAMPGFLPVTDADLVGSPLSISIPNSVAIGTYDFNVLVTSSSVGCDPFNALFTLTITPLTMIASATAAADPICANATTDLTANGVTGTNFIVTWWTAPGGTGTNLGTGLTLSNRGPGTYYARVTGDCGFPDEANVTVTSKVNVAITSATATSASVCPGIKTTLTANGISGTNALVTWWTATGGKGTNLGTGLTLSNIGPGTYYARVTGDCG